MPLNNIPNDLNQYLVFIWVFVLSIWGGTVFGSAISAQLNWGF